jgi:hypothetical protein
MQAFIDPNSRTHNYTDKNTGRYMYRHLYTQVQTALHEQLYGQK